MALTSLGQKSKSFECDSIFLADSIADLKLVLWKYRYDGLNKRQVKKAQKIGVNLGKPFINLDELCEESKKFESLNNTRLIKIKIEEFKRGSTLTNQNGIKIEYVGVFMTLYFEDT